MTFCIANKCRRKHTKDALKEPRPLERIHTLIDSLATRTAKQTAQHNATGRFYMFQFVDQRLETIYLPVEEAVEEKPNPEP